MSASLADTDPFAPNANADDYVPRRATDQAFAELERAVMTGARPVAITGPAGLGKTLLLQRLVAKVSPRLTPVYLPYASLAPDELCGWALAVLNGEPTDDPIGVFRAYLHRLSQTGKGLLLVIDDASVLPLATGRWLARFAGTSRGALRVALAAGDSPSSLRKLAALGESMEIVRLIDPMDEEETRDYLAARLDAAGVTGPRRDLFDDATVRGLFTVSRGNPRRLHAAATAVLLGRAPDSVAEFQSEASSLLAQDDAVLSALIARGGAEVPTDPSPFSGLGSPDAEPPVPPVAPRAVAPPAPEAEPVPDAPTQPPVSVPEPPPASARAPESRPASARVSAPSTPALPPDVVPGDEVPIDGPIPGDEVPVESSVSGDEVAIEDSVPGDEVAIEDSVPGDELAFDGPVPGDEIPVGVRRPGREAAPQARQERAPEPLPEAEVVPEYQEVAAMQAGGVSEEIVPEDEVRIEDDPEPEAPPGGWLRPPAPRRIEQAPALMWVMIATLGVAVAAITLPLLRGSIAQDPILPDPYPEPGFEQGLPRVPEPGFERGLPRASRPVEPDPWAAPTPLPETSPAQAPPLDPRLEALAVAPPLGETPLPVEPLAPSLAPLPDPQTSARPAPEAGRSLVPPQPAPPTLEPEFVVVPQAAPPTREVAPTPQPAPPTREVAPRREPKPVAVTPAPSRPRVASPVATPEPVVERPVATTPRETRATPPRRERRAATVAVRPPAPRPSPPRRAPVVAPSPAPVPPRDDPAIARRPQPAPPTVTRTPLPEPPEVERLPLPGPPAEVQPAPSVPDYVSVSINASPWGVIEVDGRELGETPLAGVRLTPGPHVFRARLPNGNIITQTIQISETNRTVVFD